MALFTLSISNLSPALDKKHQEVRVIAQYCELALQAMGGAAGTLTSGNIVVGGATVGSWTLVSQAAS